MTGKAKPGRESEKPRLGNLSPRYKFFLNPYADVRSGDGSNAVQ